MAERPRRPLAKLPRWALDRWVLFVILLVTMVVYAPAMDSAFYSDDYIYLHAAKEFSFTHFARVAFTPWGHEPEFPFTRDFWRPFAFLYFEVAERLFGGHVLPYHLVNLAIHAGSTVLVWRLAARLDARAVVRQTASAVFALYPGSFEAVTWISSINSAALPLALGSWLCFLRATRDPGARADRRWLTASVGLLAIGLCFRETAVALLPAMVLWYGLVQRRARVRDWRTLAVFAPFAVLGVVYVLIRTRLFTHALTNSDLYALDRHFFEHCWYYIKNALVPFRDPVNGWRVGVQRVCGVVFLGIAVLVAVRRDWKLTALVLGTLLSIAPVAGNRLGVGVRYFYFSTPLLALATGFVVAALFERLEKWQPRRVGWGAVVAFAAFLALASYSTGSRLQNWDSAGPKREQQWVESLRAAHPDLPAGGTLYCANVPLVLAIFDAANLQPTVRYYYPGVARAVWWRDPLPPVLGPDDVFFDAARPGEIRIVPVP